MVEHSKSKFITSKLTNFETVVFLCTKLHSVTSQKTVFCVPAPLRTSYVIKSVVICSISLHHLLDAISVTWFAQCPLAVILCFYKERHLWAKPVLLHTLPRLLEISVLESTITNTQTYKNTLDHTVQMNMGALCSEKVRCFTYW